MAFPATSGHKHFVENIISVDQKKNEINIPLKVFFIQKKSQKSGMYFTIKLVTKIFEKINLSSKKTKMRFDVKKRHARQIGILLTYYLIRGSIFDI